MNRFPRWAVAGLALGALCAAPLGAQSAGVLTQRNDYDRSSHNPRETILTPDAVRRSFGKLFDLRVDGQVYAQPLVVPGISIAGGVRTVVVVATAHNTVYLFDATSGDSLWARNFGAPVRTQTDQWPGGVYRDMSPESGITATPVVDSATNVLYFTSLVETTGTGGSPKRTHWLHAIDLATRQETAGAPVEIRYPVGPPRLGALTLGARDAHLGHHEGHGDPLVAYFDSDLQLQRPGLVLASGRVVLGLGSFGDNGSYNGWVFSYDARTLGAPPQVWVSTQPGADYVKGGIWQSGVGLASDGQGNVFFTTGNGAYDGTRNFADSFVKLHVGTDGALSLADWFTPCNQEELENADLDLTSGLLRFPSGRYLIGGGKQGILYVMRADSMGGYVNGDQNCWQNGVDRVKQVVVASCSTQGDTRHNHGAPVFWESRRRGPLFYVWPENDRLRAFQWRDSTVTPGNCLQQPDWAASAAPSPARLHAGMTGGMLSLSSNAGANGIVWATTPVNNNANQQVVPGVLRAYDADDLRVLLWSSCPTPDCRTRGPDDSGNYAKFTPPTVANGKVYLATMSHRVSVYGLNPPRPSMPLNLLTNGNFEAGPQGWGFQSGEGAVDSIYPYDGNLAGHLVPNDSASVRVSQSRVAPESGAYRLTALCLTSVLQEGLDDPTGPAARLGVDVNGTTVGTADAPNYAGYLPCTVDFTANRGDTITVWYESLPLASDYPYNWGSVTWSFLDVAELTRR